MRTVAEILGRHVRRIPDGEVGKRFHWIMFQPDVIGQADGIERIMWVMNPEKLSPYVTALTA